MDDAPRTALCDDRAMAEAWLKASGWMVGLLAENGNRVSARHQPVNEASEAVLSRA
jgi:hypothetical protein